MKNIFIFSVIFILSFTNVNAQCLDFAKSDGFSKLDTTIFIPDGRLNAIPLSEGDNLDVYKPFFRGRKYKIVVVGAKNLPNVNFKVVNFQRQTIFDSQEGGKSADSYEFVSDKNQNLIINVELPKGKGSKAETGCVAVIVGFTQEQ